MRRDHLHPTAIRVCIGNILSAGNLDRDLLPELGLGEWSQAWQDPYW